MTEEEWLRSDDPERMFHMLGYERGRRDSVRKARCFIRETLIPRLLFSRNDEEGKWIVAELDRWVDGRPYNAEAPKFPPVLAQRIGLTWPSKTFRGPGAPRNPDRQLARSLCSDGSENATRTRSCSLLREIFGNPF